MRQSWTNLFIFASFAGFVFTSAEMILGSTDGKRLTFDTAQWKYFGPYGRREHHDVPAIFLTGDDLCNPKSSMVGGKIIITPIGEEGTYCDLFFFVEKLYAAGALAFIYITPRSIPGWYYNWHDELNAKSHRGRSVSVFEMALPDIPGEVLDLWYSTASTGTPIGQIAKLAAPHVHEWESLFRSPLWVLVMQVFAPLFALYAARAPFNEVYRRIESNDYGDWIGFVLCVIELPCLILIAFACSYGQFGPMYLPLGFHFYLVFFFGGFSLFTTLLVALKLREMSRSVGIGRGGGYTARSIWGYYRCTIFTGFLVFVFIGEFASGLLFAVFTELAPPLQVFLFVIFTISQLFLAIYFIFQAWSMASPLVAYIEHPESNPGQEELRRIKAFVNWIVISGVSMIINTVSNLFILIGVSTAGAGKFASPLGLFFASALCAYSRIMISFSQVRSSRAGPFALRV